MIEEELDCTFTLELDATTDELDLLTDELEDLAVEEDSVTDELDCAFAPELDTTTDEPDSQIDELEELTAGDEFTCPPLEYIPVEDELSPSVSVPLFPLSPPHAAKISATASIPNNAIRCFCFICRLPLTLNIRLS